MRTLDPYYFLPKQIDNLLSPINGLIARAFSVSCCSDNICEIAYTYGKKINCIYTLRPALLIRAIYIYTYRLFCCLFAKLTVNDYCNTHFMEFCAYFICFPVVFFFLWILQLLNEQMVQINGPYRRVLFYWSSLYIHLVLQFVLLIFLCKTFIPYGIVSQQITNSSYNFFA